MPLTWLAIGFVIISRPSAQRNLPLRLLIYGASAIYALNITILYKTVSLPYIQEARIHRTEAIEHYRQILLSKDRLQDERDRLNASLQAKDYSFLDDPLGRFSLHPFVAHYMAYFGTFDGSSTHALLSPEILHHRPVSLFSRLLTILRRNGWALICAGFLLALSAMRRAPSYS